jgi:hypothetical protein
MIPRPGRTFVLQDQSQIEPRCLNYLAGNNEFLDLVRQGQDPYEAHARQTMGWTGGNLSAAGKTDKKAQRLRDTSKGRVLAGGYGCGFRKFIGMLPRYNINPDEIFCDPVTAEQETELRDWLIRAKQAEAQKEFDTFCEMAANPLKYTPDEVAEGAKMRRWWINSFLQIMDYRRTNPKIVMLWQKLGYIAELSAMRNEAFSILMPSGRRLWYFKPFLRDGETITWMVRGEHPTKVYGGLLAENCTQAFARDVFSDRLLALLDAGIDVLWTIYDEYVIEVDEMLLCTQETADKLKRLDDICSASPSFAPTLPVAVSQEVATHYKK